MGFLNLYDRGNGLRASLLVARHSRIGPASANATISWPRASFARGFGRRASPSMHAQYHHAGQLVGRDWGRQGYAAEVRRETGGLRVPAITPTDYPSTSRGAFQ